MIRKLDATAIRERQRKYIAEIEEQGFDYGVVVAQAFIKSIRDIGYKSTGTALNELVDNSIEAGASNVHVAFGYTDGSKKPTAIVTMDDGIGMIPGMLRAAVVWGGTDRHGSRDLFGRFGYGLPSASVSQGRKLSVFSRDEDGQFYAVVMDLDDIEAGKYLENNRVVVPAPERAELPEWVVEYAAEHFSGGAEKLGTVVLWEKLDRHTYKTTRELDNHILETFGITYRNVLRTTSLVVNGKPVEPVDPLFTTPGARFYDLDEDQAMADEPVSFEVRDPESRESLGWVKVRFSLMPPTFARIDKRRTDSNKSNLNKRFPILKDHNGVIVMRNGRQIDVVTKGAPTTFRNNDRYIGVEVDFPPTLDEFFGVTTHKQQITINEKIWGLLSEAGVWKVVTRLRTQWKEMNDDLESQYDSPDDDSKRPSELAMEEADDLDVPTMRSPEREEEAEAAKERQVEEVMTGKEIPREEAEREVELVEKTHPYRVEIESLPGAPFYRAEQRGMQLVLMINRSHPFFSAVYAAVPGAEGARVRQGIEVLLFVLGKAESEAAGARHDFYESERQVWSMRLATGLVKLGRHLDLNPEIDEGSELDAEPEVTVEAE